MDAYNACEPRKIDNVFIKLEKCLESSMKDNGGNNYPLPHLHKERMRYQGTPVNNIVCDPAVYNLANNLLKEPNIKLTFSSGRVNFAIQHLLSDRGSICYVAIL